MKKEIQQTVHLELSAQEAAWLNALMQNPFPSGCDGDVNPAHEDPLDREMRRKFFEATRL